MSRPHSGSPLYSRIPTLHGRRAEGLFQAQMHSSAQSGVWRNLESVKKAEPNTNWSKDSHQGEQHVDHWAKFIDAIEHAQKRGPSPVSRYRVQGEEDRPAHSPRRLPRERLPSPDNTRLAVEEHYRMPSPVWSRNDGGNNAFSSQRDHRESRDRSYPRPQEGRRPMDYEYHKEERGDQYHERESFSERSSKSDYRDHHPSPKGFSDLGLQDEFVEHHRGFSPRRAPVIVEHDHGIIKQDSRNRDPPKTSGHLRSRDPPRPSETQKNREPYGDRRDQGHHMHTLQDRNAGRPIMNPRENLRKNHPFYGREGQGNERPRHLAQSRMEAHSRDVEGRREMDLRDRSDTDLRSRERDSTHEWEEDKPQRSHGRMMQHDDVQQRPQYQRNPISNVRPAPRMDFSEKETLKIKVDMSQPIRQSSYLGYSSERQLSLDLVNVGRQRLDFLPMLEHSGTFKESAVHTGTFAQEIITLVHQVKENFFRGQGITLNERFADEQYYSLQDEDDDDYDEEEEEMRNARHAMNRQRAMPSPETQIFCNIGPEPVQKRQLIPDPGDLRYDLERRRQQRLENVKITIAGGSFAQMAAEGPESEPPYVPEEPEDVEENYRWSEPEPKRPRQWNGPRQRMPVPNRQNFRGYYHRRNRARGRRT